MVSYYMVNHIFYAIYLIITSENIWNYISAGMLLLAGCIFIVASIKLRIKNLNKFAIKKK